MSTSTELVGPLKVGKVHFRGGPGARLWPRTSTLPSVIYTPPVNTLDPRYVECTRHRVACDCREAELAEEIREYRMEFRAVRDAIEQVLAGHPTTADGEDRYGRQIKPCQCTGCQIARLISIYPKEY